MTARQLINTMREALAPLYGSREAGAIASLVAEVRYGIDRCRLVADPDAEVEVAGLDGLLRELHAMRPVQYVLGETEFCGLRLAVREGVLIPRPETEELVAAVVERYAGGPAVRLLDVGTGSGAIAVALSRRLPQAEVVGVDVSEEALAVARENASAYGGGVELYRADLFAGDFGSGLGTFDAIVSNPPYVPESDRGSMRRNVLDYEPAVALFVPDDDPLRYYRRIAEVGREMLRPGGMLFLEIYERLSQEMLGLLAEWNYVDVEVRRDIFDKPRIALCRRE